MCLLWELDIPAGSFHLETQEEWDLKFLQLPGSTRRCSSFHVNCAFSLLLPKGRPEEQEVTNSHPSQGHRIKLLWPRKGPWAVPCPPHPPPPLQPQSGGNTELARVTPDHPFPKGAVPAFPTRTALGSPARRNCFHQT